MATSEDVDHFVRTFAPNIELPQETKDSLHGLIETYESYGYSKEQLAAVIEERVPPSSLGEASEGEFSTVVAELAAPAAAESSEYTEQPVGEQPAVEQPAKVDGDAVMEDLAVALATDVSAEIEERKAEFFKHLTEQLWEQVRAEIMAEVEESEATWDSVEEAKAAAFEPAYNAMMAAVDGLWEAGEEDGGFATLLSRPESS